MAMRYKLLCGAMGIGILISACRTRNAGETSETKWGHLDDRFFVPDSPAYLVNKSKGSTFKVCLAKYMVDELPGIQTEIETAVNIWASYLGRSIPVAITVKDLPRAKAGDNANDLGKSYNSLCGKGFDTVIGYGPLDGGTVGQTNVSSMITTFPDGSKKMTSFERYLFLRDFTASPNQDGFIGWESYQKKLGSVLTKDQLLQAMSSREQLIYSLNGKLLSLAVLTHEVGHIWGLCDQYEGASNCDTNHSTSHKVLDSLMGAATSREMVYLTDDDIEGIRALGVRPGFQHDWPPTPTTPVKPLVKKPVEVFEKRGLTQSNHVLSIVFAIVTNVPSKLIIELKPKGTSQWQTLSGQESEASGFNTPHLTDNISLSPTDSSIYDVRLTLQINDGNGFHIAGTQSWVQ